MLCDALQFLKNTFTRKENYSAWIQFRQSSAFYKKVTMVISGCRPPWTNFCSFEGASSCDALKLLSSSPAKPELSDGGAFTGAIMTSVRRIRNFLYIDKYSMITGRQVSTVRVSIISRGAQASLLTYHSATDPPPSKRILFVSLFIWVQRVW